jgi:hypothetical protein
MILVEISRHAVPRALPAKREPTMPQRYLGGGAIVAICAAFATIGVGQAYAMDSCAGKYSAALLHPLAEPAVVALDLHDSSDVNVALGSAFTNGMREAGQAVSGIPTVKLTLSYQVIGQGGGDAGGGGLNQGGGGQTGWSNWSGGGAAALQGGQTLALPDFPRYDAFSAQQPVQSALLVLRVEARNTRDNTLDWIASVQCTMQGTDNQTLAYQLGYLIGGVIGKRRDDTPL